MKKLVNGKVVDIKNLELFELAAEGRAVNSAAVSKTDEGLAINADERVQTIIEQYNVILQSLPYPLCDIERDVKYAAIGTFIQRLHKNTLDMWVKKGLYIMLDEPTGMCIKMVNNTWGIVYCEHIEEDNTNLDRYINYAGYSEYSWIIERILAQDDSVDFYEKFMTEFVVACNRDRFIIQWELSNILNFGAIPNKIELVDNRIIDVESNVEYTLDIFLDKIVNRKDEQTAVWSLYGNRPSVEYKPKQQKIYGYEVYEKSSAVEQLSKAGGKIEKSELIGAQPLFVVLTGIKNSQRRNEFPKYRGVITGTSIAFWVDGSVYVCKKNRVNEAVEIARGVELYSVDRNNVYFTKYESIPDSRVKKETMYCYNISKDTIKMCRVAFK